MSRLGGLVSYDTDSDEEGGKAPSPLQATAQALAAPPSGQRRRLVSIDDAEESVPPPPAGSARVVTDGTDDVAMKPPAAPAAATGPTLPQAADRPTGAATAGAPGTSSTIDDGDAPPRGPTAASADRHDARFPLLATLPPAVEEDEEGGDPAFAAVVVRFRAYHDATLAGHSFTASLRGKRDMGNPYILQRVIGHFGIDQYGACPLPHAGGDIIITLPSPIHSVAAVTFSPRWGWCFPLPPLPVASRYPKDVFDPQALAASLATHGYVALDAAQQRHMKEEEGKARAPATTLAAGAAGGAAATIAAPGLGGGPGTLPGGAPLAAGGARPLAPAFPPPTAPYAAAAAAAVPAPPVSAAVAAARAAASNIALSSAIAAAKQAAAAAAAAGGGGRPRAKWDAPG